MHRTSSKNNNNIKNEREERTSQQQIRGRKIRLVRRIWAMVIILFLVLTIEIFTAILSSPRFNVYRIVVKPMETITSAEVIQRIALPPESNYFRVSEKELAKRIAVDPRVARVQVTKGNVGVLQVAVQERKPVCQLGHSVPPLYMDAAGYLFQRPQPPNNAVLVVDGLKLPITANIIGHRLKNEHLAVVRAILVKYNQDDSEGKLDIKRIIVDKQGWFTLILQQGTKVFVGDISVNNIDQKVWYIDKAIVAASDKGFSLDDLEFIDIRYVVAETGMGIRYHPKTKN